MNSPTIMPATTVSATEFPAEPIEAVHVPARRLARREQSP
jgi:hypothetical protein